MPLFLALELLGRHVGRGRGLARFGRELRQALRRRREPRREIRDRALKSEAERIVLGLQGLELAVGEVLVPERRLGGGERRARLVEIEPVRVLRPSPSEAYKDEGENGPVQQAQCELRLHRRPSDHGRASPATCSLHHAPLLHEVGKVARSAGWGVESGGSLDKVLGDGRANRPGVLARATPHPPPATFPSKSWGRVASTAGREPGPTALLRQLRIHFASGKGLRA